MSTYLVFAIIPMLIGLYAQFKIQSSYKKYASIRTMTGLSGFEAARKMLDSHELEDVRIESIRGTLTDHYDSNKKVLRLSEGVYNSSSIAAVGVACHEAGHAFQDAEQYGPLILRTLMVPAVNFGSKLGPILFFLGLIFASYSDSGYTISKIGLIIFSVTAAFSIITLPVEFNASERAKAWLSGSGLLYKEEIDGVSDILHAAALTYVSAAIQAITNVLYYASILNSRNSRKRR